jgi:hypothetical protein
MSDTPETDLLCGEVVPAKFARRLERERNHLLAALELALDQSWNGPLPDGVREKCAAAISKAKGEA